MTETRITFRGQTRMPIKATKEEEDAKKSYKRGILIAFIILTIIAVACLAAGIALVAVFQGKIQGLTIFGAVLISVGIVSLFAGTICGYVFFRILRSTSDTVAYYPKSADALVTIPYPRQPRRHRPRHPSPPPAQAEPAPLPEPTAPELPPQMPNAPPPGVAPPEPPPDYAPPAYSEVNQQEEEKK